MNHVTHGIILVNCHHSLYFVLINLRWFFKTWCVFDVKIVTTKIIDVIDNWHYRSHSLYKRTSTSTLFLPLRWLMRLLHYLTCNEVGRMHVLPQMTHFEVEKFFFYMFQNKSWIKIISSNFNRNIFSLN